MKLSIPSIPGIVVSTFLLLQITASCSLDGGQAVIITREPEESEEFSGWGNREYFTGIALEEEQEEPAVGNYIYLEVYIPLPGRYFPWALAAMNSLDSGRQKQLKITLTPVRANSLSRVDSAIIPVKPTRALEWMPATGRKNWLEFPDFGSYFLTIEAEGPEDARIIFDKFLLTNSPNYVPTGYAVVPDTVDVVLPPDWAFGVLYGGYTDQEETRNRIDSIIDQDLPIDGYWLDSWFWDYENRGSGPQGYIDFVGDTTAYPDLESLWDYMARRHIKSGIWIWDAIQQPGNEKVFQSFEEQGYFNGVPYEDTSGWHNSANGTMIGDIDFENEAAVRYWKSRMEPLFKKGLDFLKLDRSSAVPFMQAAFEATQELGRASRGRGFILSRLQSAYHPEMKRFPAKWTGNAKIAWEQPGYPDLDHYAMGGLRENIIMVTDPLKSTYEVPFLTHDAGGFNSFEASESSDSLYMRWIQFSMLNPITTIFTSYENPTANLPFRFSKEALENFRYYSHLKLQLFPYIYSYALRTRETKRKMVQGFFNHPQQYLFGRELLVAPVSERGAVSREVYLPSGQWIDFYSHRLFQGDTVIRYAAPIDRLPLLVRAGSILPMRPYARSVEMGSRDSLILEVYPGDRAKGSFTLSEDDGRSNDYLQGRVAKTTFYYEQNNRGLEVHLLPSEGAYDGMPEERFYALHILQESPPSAVLLDGEELSRSAWNFDQDWVEIRVGRLSTGSEHTIRLNK